MSALWQRWYEQFARLQARERIILWAASSGVVVWLGLFYGVMPLLENQQRLEHQLKSNVKRISDLTEQVSLIEQQLQQDVNASIRADISDRQQQESALIGQIRQMTGRYVSPEQMTALLTDVLHKQPQVKLTSLRNLAAVPLQLPGFAEGDLLLYRHGTVIQFSGRYAQLQDLVLQLEQLKWQLRWHRLQYQVSEYPLAHLELELETVSEQADYLRL